jgi:hypothetical protein
MRGEVMGVAGEACSRDARGEGARSQGGAQPEKLGAARDEHARRGVRKRGLEAYD